MASKLDPQLKRRKQTKEGYSGNRRSNCRSVTAGEETRVCPRWSLLISDWSVCQNKSKRRTSEFGFILTDGFKETLKKKKKKKEHVYFFLTKLNHVTEAKPSPWQQSAISIHWWRQWNLVKNSDTCFVLFSSRFRLKWDEIKKKQKGSEMNQSDSPRPTQVSCWGWIQCKQRIMIRYLVKSSTIRSFWFTDRWRIDQSQSSQEPSLTDQTQGRQSRVLSQGLVNEKVLSVQGRRRTQSAPSPEYRSSLSRT